MCVCVSFIFSVDGANRLTNKYQRLVLYKRAKNIQRFLVRGGPLDTCVFVCLCMRACVVDVVWVRVAKCSLVWRKVLSVPE